MCLYGWISARFEIPEDRLISGILWSWLDNQMLVAAKAIPLGQNALQGVLATLKPVIIECVGLSRQSATKEAYSTVPLLSILSAQHEKGCASGLGETEPKELRATCTTCWRGSSTQCPQRQQTM